MGIFFGVAKISNIFWGCLKFLKFFGGEADPTYAEKLRVPPPPPTLGVTVSEERQVTKDHSRFPDSALKRKATAGRNFSSD